MSRIRRKHPRLRLAPEPYEQLRLEVLRRDGWRCQYCGSQNNLQTYHKQFRGRSEDDSEQNLITLCAACHNSLQSGK
jgi:5-methylcytosine-specific restriction endonuclease McrA